MSHNHEHEDEQSERHTNMITLTGADFDEGGNVYFNSPIELSHIKVGEIKFTNNLSIVDNVDGLNISWYEEGHPTSLGFQLGAVIAGKQLLEQLIEKRMSETSNNGRVGLQFSVEINEGDGKTTISAVKSGTSTPGLFKLNPSKTLENTLGFRLQPHEPLGSKHTSTFIANLAFNNNAIAVVCDLVPSTSSSIGKNQQPVLCVAPVTENLFGTVVYNPISPWLWLGGSKVINSLNIRFMSVDLLRSYNEYLLTPTGNLYITLMYW